MQVNRSQLIITGLVVLLAATLWGTYLIGVQAQTYYFQLNATRLNPQGLHVYPTSAAPPEIAADKQLVVLFGDSRAAKWPTPNDHQRFQFINRGISAQTSTQVQQRFAAHVAPLQPDIVLVQVGINDLKAIGLFAEQEEMIITAVINNIDQIVADAQAINATVILTTVFPTGEIPLIRQPFWSSNIDPAIERVNDHIQTLASDDVIVFDAYAVLADENGRLSPEIAADELHLHPKGYRWLNEALFDILADLPSA